MHEETEVDEKIFERISNTRAWLALFYPFYGYLLLKMRCIPTKKLPFPTLATDGRNLYFDPDYVTELTDGELKGALLHEALHIAMLHPTRVAERDPIRWNLAGDYAINPFVKEASNVNSSVTLARGWLLDEKYAGMSTDQIYEILPECPQCALDEARERERQREQQSQDGQQDGQEEGQEGGEQQNSDGKQAKTGSSPGKGKKNKPKKGDPGEHGHDHNHDDSGGSCPHHNKRCGGILEPRNPDGSPMTEGDRRRLEAELKQDIAGAMQQAKLRGRMPADLERLISEMLEPKVDWQDQLARMLDITAKNDFSWQRPNRKYLSQGVYLPSLYSQELGEIVLAIDTSGSIGEKELNQFASELRSILERFHVEKMHVVYCDAEIAGTEEFDSSDFIVGLRAKGGGGTDYVPPFRWVAREGIQPVCLIYLTDLCCNSYPEEPEYPVIWVSTSGQPMGAPPFGEVIEIEIH